MSKRTSRTHRGPGRWIWSSLLVMLLLGPCGACWGLTKGLYESSGNTPGPRPYLSQGLTNPERAKSNLLNPFDTVLGLFMPTKTSALISMPMPLALSPSSPISESSSAFYLSSLL